MVAYSILGRIDMASSSSYEDASDGQDPAEEEADSTYESTLDRTSDHDSEVLAELWHIRTTNQLQ